MVEWGSSRSDSALYFCPPLRCGLDGFASGITFGDKLCNKQDGSKLVWLRKRIEKMGLLPISSSITKSGHEPKLSEKRYILTDK